MPTSIYCTYLTVYTGNKLPTFYIGSTSTNNIQNGYHGSVLSKEYKAIWKQELKSHPELFKTIVLTTHNTREEAMDKERHFQLALNTSRSGMYINKAIASKDFFLHGTHTEDTKEILRQKRLVQADPRLGTKHSEESKNKMSEKRLGVSPWNTGIVGEASHTYGKRWKRSTPPSDEWIRKQRERMTGEGNPFYGKSHTEEALNKIKQAPLGKKRVYREDGTFYMARPEDILNAD